MMRGEDPSDFHCSCCSDYDQRELVQVDLRPNMRGVGCETICAACVADMAAVLQSDARRSAC
jgi:hypothetical protein